MFGQLVDQVGFPKISSKCKLSNFRLSIQRVRMPQIRCVHIVYLAYALFVSLGQLGQIVFWALVFLPIFTIGLGLGL